jgi:hypothetical protein
LTKTRRTTTFAGVLAAALLAVTSLTVTAQDDGLFDDWDELPNPAASVAGPLQVLFATDDDADDVLEQFGVDLDDDVWEIDDADDADDLVATNSNGRFLTGNAAGQLITLCLWASEPDDRDECLGGDDDDMDDDIDDVDDMDDDDGDDDDGDDDDGDDDDGDDG